MTRAKKPLSISVNWRWLRGYLKTEQFAVSRILVATVVLGALGVAAGVMLLNPSEIVPVMIASAVVTLLFLFDWDFLDRTSSSQDDRQSTTEELLFKPQSLVATRRLRHKSKKPKGTQHDLSPDVRL